VVEFAAAQSEGKMSDIHITFQRIIDGRQDYEQRWKECIDVLSRNLPFAIGAAYVKRFMKAEAKTSTMEMFNNIKEEFNEQIANAAWIDESSRVKLLSKLKSLIPLIAYPDAGFDEQAINEFYDSIKLDKSQYLRTLFQLRVIDADNKFRQTYTSTSLESQNDWKKYSPPTAVTAFYSQSDNTIRKRRHCKLHQTVINF
jgi:predicted metalloendopeptidase